MSETQETQKEIVVLGAGAIIASNMVIMAQAYADMDYEVLYAQRNFWMNLDKVIEAYRQLDNKLFDQANSGYLDATWLNGPELTEEEVKADEPRKVINRLYKKKEVSANAGRKAKPKPDYTSNC